MNDDRLKRIALALQKLVKDNEPAENLGTQGLSVMDLASLLEILTEELQMVGVLTMDDSRISHGDRVFSRWEQVILPVEVRHFLLSALHYKAITSAELEHALALAFTQFTSYVDVEEMYDLLKSVVEDEGRGALFTTLEHEYSH